MTLICTSKFRLFEHAFITDLDSPFFGWEVRVEGIISRTELLRGNSTLRPHDDFYYLVNVQRAGGSYTVFPFYMPLTFAEKQLAPALPAVLTEEGEDIKDDKQELGTAQHA